MDPFWLGTVGGDGVLFIMYIYKYRIEYKDPLNDRVLSVATRHSICFELQRGKENICFLFSGLFLLFEEEKKIGGGRSNGS